MSKLHPAPAKNPAPLVPVSEVAAFFGLSKKTIYRRYHDGTLVGYRAGREIRFRWNDIEAFLAANRGD